MKNVTLTKLITATFILFGLMASAQAINGKSSKIVVSGTSPMHDWTMSASGATFSGTVSDGAINNVKFVVPAKNLKSTKGKMMDNKAYSALKADKAPNISFTATSLKVGKYNLAGKLSIAGVTKNVSIPVNVTKTGNSYTITGKETMTLSEYGMERPGFMGVRTGDAITVDVNIVAN